MKLADLRRLAVKKAVRIRFRLQGGMECVLDEHGVARLPELRTRPDFNLEESLAQAGEFIIEPAGAGKRAHPETLSREQLAALAEAPSAAMAQCAEHED